MRACVLVFLLLAASSSARPTATRIPTATPTAVATATPSPTVTPYPSPTAVPTVATGAYVSRNGNQGWCLAAGIGCFSWLDFFGSLVAGALQWVIGGINAIVNGLTSILTMVVRVDQWPLLWGFFTFMLAVGGGMAGALCVVGALRYYRSLLPGGTAGDGASGLAMMTRTLETAALLTGLRWGIGQVLDVLQALSSAVATYSGLDGAAALTSMLAVFTDQASNPLTALVGIVAVVVYVLILLVKLGSVAVLAWLFVVAPLCAATWPLGGGIMGAWLRAFVSVGLWGVAWGIWLKIAVEMLADFTLPALFKPFLVLALLLMGYGLPRLVDMLFQTAVARVAGAYGVAGGAVAGITVAATGPRQWIVQRGSTFMGRLFQ